MKNWYLAFFVIAITLFSCSDKKLNVSYFDMDIPHRWDYEPSNGTDSFTGTVTTSSGSITFDYSTKGYASTLILTEQQYLTDQTNWALTTCYFCEPGVTYISKNNFEQEKKRLISQSLIVGAPPLKVDSIIEYSKSISVPQGKWKRYYPGADYLAELKYRDSTIYVPIRIPQSIKKHNIHIDTTDNYIIKTIWPQTIGEGTTGIYIKSRKSSLNFNMQGTDLNSDEQAKALKAFKTIKFKE